MNPASTHYDNCAPGYHMYLWTSSIYNPYVYNSTPNDGSAWARYLYYLDPGVKREPREAARDGAVRCVKDGDYNSQDIVVKNTYYRNYQHTSGGIGFEIKQYGSYSADNVDNIVVQCYRLTGTSTVSFVQMDTDISLENDIFEGEYSDLLVGSTYYFRAVITMDDNVQYTSAWVAFTVKNN